MQSIASMITIIVKTQATVLLRRRIRLDKNKELWIIKGSDNIVMFLTIYFALHTCFT